MPIRRARCGRCRAAAAGAVLKPQGGNCAVLPKASCAAKRENLTIKTDKKCLTNHWKHGIVYAWLVRTNRQGRFCWRRMECLPSPWPRKGTGLLPAPVKVRQFSVSGVCSAPFSLPASKQYSPLPSCSLGRGLYCFVFMWRLGKNGGGWKI